MNGGTNLNRTAAGTAILSGSFLIAITITDGGVGYLEAPTITITDATGSNATARATITAGAVTDVVVANPGRGYSSPRIAFAPPPPNYAYETLWSNDGSSTAGAEPVLAVPIHVSQGAFSANLGDTNLSGMTSILAPAVFMQPDVRLRVWFNDGTTGFQQFYPDQRLTASPYALIAASVTEAAVGGAQIAPGAVGPTALAPESVGLAALAPGGVGTAKLADGAVTADKLAADVGSLGRITGGALSTTGGRVGVNGALDVAGKVTATTIQGNGAVPWEVVLATTAQAAPNTGYLADNDAPVVVTLPASPALGDVVRLAGKGAGGWRIEAGAGQHIRISVNPETGWIARGKSGNWSAVACSRSGATMVAVGSGTPIMISEDAGLSWNSRETERAWSNIACSADGSRLAATAVMGSGEARLFTSGDRGMTWRQHEIAGEDWIANVTCSADGSKLVAFSASRRVFASADSGLTWHASEVSLPGGYSTATQVSWPDAVQSADGSRLLACVNAVGLQTDGSFLATSSDSGKTWDVHGDTLRTNEHWTAVTFSVDGAKAVATWQQGSAGGVIQTSENFGGSWSLLGLNGRFRSVACSADGDVIVALAEESPIYRSDNFGRSWEVQEMSRWWDDVAIAADATRLIAIVQGGRIWTFNANATPVQIVVPNISGDASAAIELQYLGDGKFRTLSREGNVTY